MFTMSANVFKATLEQVTFMAELCDLQKIISSDLDEVKNKAGLYPGYDHYHMWWDHQTGGGGCRLVWKDGIVWVSRHSGYAYADITQEVCDLFTDMGCTPLDNSHSGKYRNPSIYG